jgi:hypothetical protein
MPHTISLTMPRRKKEILLPDYPPKLDFKELPRIEMKIPLLIYIQAADPIHPRMNKKPKGVKYIGVRIAITNGNEEPRDEDYITVSRNSRIFIRLSFKPEDAGKRVFIKAFYIGHDMAQGRQSDAISAIIS